MYQAASGRLDRHLSARHGLKLVAQRRYMRLHGVRRDLELAKVRRESLQAMADVRARLGRDLHDGIAPLLAGAGLTAEALRRGMPDGTADERAAQQLASRLRGAAGEIRRLAYDLQLAASADGTVDHGDLIGEVGRELAAPTDWTGVAAVRCDRGVASDPDRDVGDRARAAAAAAVRAAATRGARAARVSR
jgi:signal transduction histidine kinase